MSSDQQEVLNFIYRLFILYFDKSFFQSPPSHLTIDQLPTDVLVIVFGYFDPKTICIRFAPISRRWHRLAYVKSLWHHVQFHINASAIKRNESFAMLLTKVCFHPFYYSVLCFLVDVQCIQESPYFRLLHAAFTIDNERPRMHIRRFSTVNHFSSY